MLASLFMANDRYCVKINLAGNTYLINTYVLAIALWKATYAVAMPIKCAERKTNIIPTIAMLLTSARWPLHWWKRRHGVAGRFPAHCAAPLGNIHPLIELSGDFTSCGTIFIDSFIGRNVGLRLAVVILINAIPLSRRKNIYCFLVVLSHIVVAMKAN